MTGNGGTDRTEPEPVVLVPRTVPADLAAIMSHWLDSARWYPRGVRSAPEARQGAAVGGARWDEALCAQRSIAPSEPGDDGAVLQWWALRTGETWIQVPLVLIRRADRTRAAGGSATVTEVRDWQRSRNQPAGGPGWRGICAIDGDAYDVFDAPYRSEYIRTLIGAASDAPPALANASRVHVLSGEQSNTSTLVPGGTASSSPGVIVKTLRVLTDGPQPDIDVPRALRATGFDRVPSAIAGTSLRLDDGQYLDGWDATAAIVSELIPEAEDGFTLACAMAAEGADFAAEAARLATLVARLHAALRTAYPSTGMDTGEFVSRLRLRSSQAGARSARIQELLGPIDSFIDQLEIQLGAWPYPLVAQRIHGDLHLGQVIRGSGSGPRSGWWVIDFEGEPMRPYRERVAPDVTARDIAGMLRSFDYAAATAAGYGARGPASPSSADDTAASWAAVAGDAFLTHYLAWQPDTAVTATSPAAAAAALAPHQPRAVASAIVTACLLDKAIYEVCYEEQHRPHWVGIPLAGLRRILAGFV